MAKRRNRVEQPHPPTPDITVKELKERARDGKLRVTMNYHANPAKADEFDMEHVLYSVQVLKLLAGLGENGIAYAVPDGTHHRPLVQVMSELEQQFLIRTTRARPPRPHKYVRWAYQLTAAGWAMVNELESLADLHHIRRQLDVADLLRGLASLSGDAICLIPPAGRGHDAAMELKRVGFATIRRDSVPGAIGSGRRIALTLAGRNAERLLAAAAMEADVRAHTPQLARPNFQNLLNNPTIG
ncbi:MAG TPA: hypothetical protein VFC78_01240 [Tepidisphaeraceae bacterium]|nr:hypothetical protein [Tepidisphaeraceae bacterium]